MLEIPLYIFLFLYFVFLAIFAAFYLIIIYHIIHSASFTLASFLMSFFIFAVTVLTLYGTITFLEGIDWQQIAVSIDFGLVGDLFSS